MKIRQDTRLLAVLFVFLVFLVTLLVMAGESQTKEHRTNRLEDYPGPKIELPNEPEPRRRAIVVSKWLRSVLENAGIPVVQDTDEEEEQADRGCILIGKLIWENKPWLPLKGVELRLTEHWLDTIVPTERRKANDPLLLPPKATTDKWGKFVLRDVPTRETLFLLVRKEGRTLMVKKLRHLPLPGQKLNLYEVEVPEQGTLKGRVVDDDGKPLSGILVRAISDPLNRGPLRDEGIETRRIERASFFRAHGWSGPSVVPPSVIKRNRLLPFPKTTTHTDGTFLLHGARAGRLTLLLQGDRTALVERDVDVMANEVTNVGTLIARAGKPQRIRIFSVDEKSVIGADVSITVRGWPLTMEPLQTDGDGVVSCECLPEGDLQVFVRPRRSQAWELAHRYTGHRVWSSKVDLRYQLGYRGHGFVDVVDPSGQPVADAVASLSLRDSAFTTKWVQLPKHVSAVESRPGSFELQNLPLGQFMRLVIAAPDHAPAVLGFAVRPGRGPLQAGGLQVRLRPVFPVRFQVRGANDQPVARATVSVRFKAPPKYAPPGTDDHLLSHGGAVLGHTDENGVLETPALWQSPAWFAAWHPDYGLTPTHLTHPLPGTTVSIKLRPTGRVSGELKFEGEQPAARWIIRARPAEYFSSTYEKNPFLPAHRTATSPDGSFYFNDLFEGRWRLSLHRLAPDPERMQWFRWPDGEHTEVDAVAGMTVLHVWDVPGDRRSLFQITGTARLDGRPLPHAVVRLHHTLVLFNPHSMLKAAEATMHRAVRDGNKRLWQQLKLMGKEMRKTWKVPPLESLPRAMFPVTGPPDAAVKADARGRFKIPLRVPGVYDVRLADAQGKQELARALTSVRWTRDKAARQAEVHFDLHTGSLRLAVTTHETLRVRLRTLLLTQEPDGAVFHLRTDHQGDVFVPRIPAGTYRLSIRGRGVNEARIRNSIIEITAGTLTTHHAYTDPYVRKDG